MKPRALQHYASRLFAKPAVARAPACGAGNIVMLAEKHGQRFVLLLLAMCITLPEFAKPAVRHAPAGNIFAMLAEKCVLTILQLVFVNAAHEKLMPAENIAMYAQLVLRCAQQCLCDRLQRSG